MSEQTVKEPMQQALDMLEKGGLNCEQEEFVAQSIRKAIEDYTSCEQDVGLLKIVLEQNVAQLKSCAIALAERDASLEEYKQAETQEPVRRLSEDELNEFVDNIAAARKMVSFKDVMIMTMDACGIKGGEL